MRKQFSLLLIVLFPLFLFTGCEKDKSITFTATIRSYHDTGKAFIDNQNYACWTNGDQVKINNTVSSATVTSRNDSTHVTLSGVPVSESGYYAIYPASAHSGSGAFAGGSTITLPEVQQYRVVNGHQVLEAPMAAKANSDNVMLFSNLCFLLKVHIGQANNMLKAIMVTAIDNTVKLSGTGTVTFSGEGVPSLNMVSGTNSVTLNMADAVNLNVTGGVDFYIAIPALASNQTLDVVTKDMIGNRKKVRITTQSAIPSNVIATVAGPEVPSNSDYDFFDWIQSRSSGYINLGVRPIVGAKMELTFSLTTAESAKASQYLCGSRRGSTQYFTLTGYSGQTRQDSGFVAQLCNMTVCNSVNRGGWRREAGKKYSMSVEVVQEGSEMYGIATFDNMTDNLTNVLYTPRTSSTNLSTAPNVYVFGFNYNDLHTGMRMYSFRYYEGTNLVHEFVPCRRRSDNAIGVYDLAGNRGFILPTQTGTNPFTVGND